MADWTYVDAEDLAQRLKGAIATAKQNGDLKPKLIVVTERIGYGPIRDAGTVVSYSPDGDGPGHPAVVIDMSAWKWSGD